MIACQSLRWSSSVCQGRHVQLAVEAMATVPAISNCCWANRNVWSHSIGVSILCGSALGHHHVPSPRNCDGVTDRPVCCSMPARLVCAISNRWLCYSITMTMSCYAWDFAMSLKWGIYRNNDCKLSVRHLHVSCLMSTLYSLYVM